jgi:hypothetical protein
MTGDQSGFRPSRLRLLVLLVLGATAAAAALLVVRENQVRRQVFTKTLQEITTAGQQSFFAFVRPVRRGLNLVREYDRNGTLEWSDPAALEQRFLPLLQIDDESPFASLSLISATGDEYVLRRGVEGWDSTHSTDGSLGLRATDWYAGALDLDSEGELFWTELDSEAQHPAAAVTAAISWVADAGSGRPHVAALGIDAASFQSFMDELPVTGNGLALLPADDGSVLWFSSDSAGLIEPKQFARFLGSPDGRTALIDRTLEAWRAADWTTAEPLRVRHDGEVWWFLFAAHADEAVRRIGFLVPRRDLAAKLEVVTDPWAYALFGVIAVAMLALIRLAFGYRRRLIELAGGTGHSGASEEQLRALIARGESERLEFKSTLRWNLKSNKPGREIELAWLKTVVAFMNSRGGTLIIGVHDDGTAVGTEADGFRNDDKYLLHFNNLINKHVGLEYGRYLSFDLRPLDGKKLLVVDCRRAKEPAFLRLDEDEDFYVRIGPASRKLSLRKTLEHLQAAKGRRG